MSNMTYNRCGNSGLLLPAITLGLWHNFGEDVSHQSKRALCRQAIDLGISHFDLANNYGPPPGSAEEAFGVVLREDFAKHRDELIVSTKAGYRMWSGPYGEWGSRKYMIASLDQSLKRLGLDYVDIFYSHRFDPDTPLEETMGALDFAVRSGRALYAGISNYPAEQTRQAAILLRGLGTPCLVHQPRYNLLQREAETSGVLDSAKETGMGVIAFSPLAQGLLTEKYLETVPAGSRATQGKSLDPGALDQAMRRRLASLASISTSRGQSLAQMAITWILRNSMVTSALIGASRPEQIVDCVDALQRREFESAELQSIEEALAM